MIMDKRSGVDEITLNETANTLYQRFINVIPVAIGGEADKRELRLTTKDESNLIEAPKVFKPDKLGEAIMWKVFKGILRVCVLASMGYAGYTWFCTVLNKWLLFGLTSAFIVELKREFN